MVVDAPYGEPDGILRKPGLLALRRQGERRLSGRFRRHGRLHGGRGVLGRRLRRRRFNRGRS
eukprot:15472448-Alexandrium_andersonii.AAC.1